MRQSCWILGLFLGAVALNGTVALAQAPGFHLVGLPSGTVSGRVTGLSADGVVAAGYTFGAGPQNAFGFRWTSAQGRMDLTTAQGFPLNVIEGLGISGDGAFVVGDALLTGGRRAFRWHAPATVDNLGVLPGYTSSSYAQGASGDGSVVAGYSATAGPAPFKQAFRWTPPTGMQGLGVAPGTSSSEAKAISRDGNVIVGFSSDPAQSEGLAFRWTSAGGMHVLPYLPDPRGSYSTAVGVNFDGSIVVGWSGYNSVPVSWIGDEVIALGFPAGFDRGGAGAVNDDGSVIVGGVSNSLSQIAPAVWTPSGGPQLLADYLTGNGFPLPPGVLLATCASVSADGLSFAGEAYADGHNQGYVVTIPTPPTVLMLLPGLGWWTHVRRRRTA